MSTVTENTAVETETETPVITKPKAPKPKAKVEAPKAKKAAPKVKEVEKPAPKAKKAVKEAAKEEKPLKESPMEITAKQYLLLKALKSTSEDGKTLTRVELREVSGVHGNLDRMIGASTREDGGRGGEKGLEHRGFVRSCQEEGERCIRYYITAKGKKFLEVNKG
jgi:DNA-binding MarR family transcriptional regulator